ncbi:cyclic nucleotide-binding domain-containing protein [Synechococcus elongatus]|uniref:Cyclic nucleotide-binding domain (cNMP-BD) protein n=2 Tax=Synechococcus elongatus TaxID=32046 RepID=Q31RQ1_SYNE7|nr:cyclic nucleotide-binding domain-containing protein [Synechococcus elongatus]MBD2689168.1 cyclic nucleotide-binding domain-containing protein [Synechococcus elongatus FACHB-1061]ABB56268.1 cyclic nucleotide-binding domain (cNMP-BD) protein [Synechococcus elongatus PCC 7942 = FACHB-805]AJD56683.1 cyclic nucleotide-binding protein [Synechococcus elongatus UTEX 2973]MBD2588100.1 cyclic nucleotide-binding domain-containing protein [Synechococcus elongatus FACHB-242]MBD2707192.1 cyclic nucleotid
MEKHRISAGACIYREGDNSNSIFLVRAGEIEVTSFYPETGQVVEQTFKPGQLLGEMELVDGRPRTATAQARSECLLLEIQRTELLSLLQDSLHATAILGAAHCDRLSKLLYESSFEAELARLQLEMQLRIREAILQHEQRVVQSHHGMLAIAIPLIVVAGWLCWSWTVPMGSAYAIAGF